MNDIEPALKFIASSLAPAVIFIAIGLLLAGLQMKYTSLIGEIRQLNAERRADGGDTETESADPQRLRSIREQMQNLLKRAYLVRSALLCLYGSVVLFLIASFLVGTAGLGVKGLTVPIVGVFAIGLLAVLAGTLFAFREAQLSYDVVVAEMRDLEQAGAVALPNSAVEAVSSVPEAAPQ